MSKCNLVVFVNPPNTEDLNLSIDQGVTIGVQHTDWANLPHLGILSLASFVDGFEGLESVYLDGVVCPWNFIKSFIIEHHSRILAVCVSCLTASYGAALQLLQHIKQIDRQITTIVGNDHISAFYEVILAKRQNLIDYALIGNEVYDSLRNLLVYIKNGSHAIPESCPGLAVYQHETIFMTSQAPEPIFTGVNYEIIDRHFQHTKIYNQNFRKRLQPRLYEIFNRHISCGVPVEIARGCVKFSNNNACSFCSIQYGGMWKNEVDDTRVAWDILLNAFQAGYEYLYITADELPLTFANLIERMHSGMPEIWHKLSENERPILMGYARADGLKKAKILSNLHDIGVRIFMVGLDAGIPISLAAMNKPLGTSSGLSNAESMLSSNLKALERVKIFGMKIKAGFVIGHIGMNRRILQENVKSICNMIDHGKESLLSVDVEVLSPEPGSKDFGYSTNPDLATKVAEHLNLKIANAFSRQEVAQKYQGIDLFSRQQLMQDYISVLMPELTLEELAAYRDEIRRYATSQGVLVGQDI